MLVFGGRSSGVELNDVWSLSLAGTPTWTQLSPTAAEPGARWDHTAIFDVPRNRMVVYGGNIDFIGLVDEVWALSLAGTPSWSHLSTTGGPPPPRWQHSAVFDSPRNRMLVFGGFTNVGGTTLADPTVWALDLAGSPAWSTLTVGGGATSMADHVAVYDPTRDAMLVAGQDLNSTQALNLSGSPSWGTLGLVGPSPAGRLGAGAAFDTANDRWAVVSGNNGAYRNDVIALSFPSAPYGLDLQVSPSGSGNVQTNPSGKCFTPGTMVTLTAFAGLGYAFSNWSGDATGSTNPLTVTMSSSKSITANFVGYPVNLTVAPAGSGTVSKSPNQATYAPGTQVTLTANSNVPFVGWSGDASGNANPLTITVDGPKNITATFDAFTVTTAVAPTGTGAVTKTPNQNFYSTGAIVTLQATPATGYQFSSWTGDVTGTEPSVDLTVDGNKNVTANFALAPPVCGGFSLIPATTKPSGRSWAHTMWDPVRHRMLMQGGYRHTSPGLGPVGDTWALTLGPTPTWTQLASTGPIWSQGTPFYDPVRDRFMVFGGNTGFGFFSNSLWALPLSGPSTWVEVTTTGTAPQPRSGLGLIYDPLRDRMLMFGGNERCGSTCVLKKNDVWQLTLGGTPTWTQIFPLGTLPPAGDCRAIYDPLRDRMVVMTAGNDPIGVWALSLSGTPTWTDLTAFGAPHFTSGFFEANQTIYDPVRDRVIATWFDGSGRISTLDFKLQPNQPLWSQVYPSGTQLGNRSDTSPLLYDPDDDIAILFGGTLSSDTDFDTSFRLDLGGGFQVDAGGVNGHVERSKWCYGTGEVATLVAAPNQGYKFNQWLGDASGNSNPLQLTMNAYKVVRAEFVPAVTGADDDLPVAFAINVQPNPSNGPADIAYALPHETSMKLRIFDIAGREVARLVDGSQPAGRHVARWSGTTAGPRLRAGLYVVRLETKEGSWSKRFALLR